MADYFGATIYIGGQLSAKELPFFIQTISNEIPGCGDLDDDMSPEDLMNFFGDTTNEYDGSTMLEADGSIKFYGEGRYGKFDDLEEFCVSHGLTFIRYSDAYAEYDADVEWWGPGMETTRNQTCDNEYNPTIRAAYIKDMMRDIEQFNPDEAPLHINDTPGHNQEYLAKWVLNNTWDKWEALKGFIDHISPEPPASAGEFEIISDT